MREVTMPDTQTGGLKRIAADPAQFLITPQFTLLGANLSADLILKRGDAVKLTDGVVTAVKPALEETMIELVSNASHKGYRTLLTCETDDGDMKWAASARTLLAVGATPQSILVTIRPLVKSEPLPGPDLASLFSLTPAEARLAADLAAGHTLAEIADMHSVHISTLRAQLRSIFSKTGVSKQSEFVSAVWRAASV
ncbi:MAG: helix-turn-helix transcriptional regulator [Oceanicaulis sp.]